MEPNLFALKFHQVVWSLFNGGRGGCRQGAGRGWWRWWNVGHYYKLVSHFQLYVFFHELRIWPYHVIRNFGHLWVSWRMYDFGHPPKITPRGDIYVMTIASFFTNAFTMLAIFPRHPSLAKTIGVAPTFWESRGPLLPIRVVISFPNGQWVAKAFFCVHFPPSRVLPLPPPLSWSATVRIASVAKDNVCISLIGTQYNHKHSTRLHIIQHDTKCVGCMRGRAAK